MAADGRRGARPDRRTCSTRPWWRGSARMELKARTIVEGLTLGLHRSPYHGFSTEFAEYRPYVVGDDPAWIDWKVYARSDRYYVKKWDADTNLSCHLLLDTSASMGYGSGAMTKLTYAATLAAAIAWLVSGQRDAVGLTTFDEHVGLRLPARVRAGHLHQILLALETGEAERRQRRRQAAARAGRKPGAPRPDRPHLRSARRSRGRGQRPDAARRARHGSRGLPRPRRGRADVPVRGAAAVPRSRVADEVLAVPSAVRDHYLAELGRHTDTYARALNGVGMDYQVVSTATPLDASLLGYLRARARR